MAAGIRQFLSFDQTIAHGHSSREKHLAGLEALNAHVYRTTNLLTSVEELDYLELHRS